MNKTYISILFFALLVSASILGGFYVGLSSFTGPQTGLDWYAGGPSASTYVFDTNGTHFFAYNGTTNHLDISSSNASYVSEMIMGNLTTLNYQGAVEFTAGTFTFTNSIMVPVYPAYAPILKGQGMKKTILQLADGANCDLIRSTATALVRWFELRELSIYGNKDNNPTGGYGVNLWGQQMTFHHVEIVDCRNATLRLHGGTGVAVGNIVSNCYIGGIAQGDPTPAEAVIFDDDVTDCHIEQCKIRYALGTLIYMKDGSNHVSDNHLSDGEYGVYAQGVSYSWIQSNWIDSFNKTGIAFVADSGAGCQWNHVLSNKIRVNNRIEANNTYYGLSFDDLENDKWMGYNEIIGNQIYRRSGVNPHTLKYGIYLNATGVKEDYNQLCNNRIDDAICATEVVFLEGTHDVFKDNMLGTTPSTLSGTFEASNDDWTAHGLYSTPDYVLLTVIESDATYTVQVKAVNSTHIQIYLYDITAGAAEAVDKTINYYMEWRP